MAAVVPPPGIAHLWVASHVVFRLRCTHPRSWESGPMRFDKLDLNLLVTLDALIELKSVSSTAEHLNLTQSAVSGALKRLREYFNDELLARDGRSMVLTGKAQQLAPAIRAILLQVRSTITNPSEFDPATAVRCFTLGCSDYVAMIVGHDLALQVQNEAPGISFKFLPLISARWRCSSEATSIF
jgi:DNA-binding transcriptional LysR family regulator